MSRLNVIEANTIMDPKEKSGEERTFKAGTGLVEITPPLGVDMAGYRRRRKAEGIGDPLYAKALLLNDGERELAFIACDLICIGNQEVGKARRLIGQRCGIPPEYVAICATHTHTGPVTHVRMPLGKPDPDYMRTLPRKIADSVATAKANAKDAFLKVGIGREEELSFNRRAGRRGRKIPAEKNELMDLLTTGNRPLRPQIPSQQWTKASKCIDPDVGVLYVEDLENKPIAFLLNFALHLDTVGGSFISSDYPAFLSDRLNKLKGKAVVLFANGPCGDINHVNQVKGVRLSTKHIGTVLAGEAIKTSENAGSLPWSRLNATRKVLEIQRRMPSSEELRAAGNVLKNNPEGLTRRRIYADEITKLSHAQKTQSTEIYAASIGELAIVGLPGEVFVEFGLQIKEKSPFAYTFVTELTNGYVGYVPTKEAFNEGGYEVMLAGTSNLIPEAGEQMVSEAIELLNGLKENSNE